MQSLGFFSFVRCGVKSVPRVRTKWRCVRLFCGKREFPVWQYPPIRVLCTRIDRPKQSHALQHTPVWCRRGVWAQKEGVEATNRVQNTLDGDQRCLFIIEAGSNANGTTVEVGILRRVGPRHLPTRRTSPTRRAPTPCTTLYDASYIPDASGPDTLYDTVRRVVQCRTTLYDAVRHCTTLYDTVRHCTTRCTVSYDAGTTQYDTVRHSTTQYDTVRHSTTQYDTVRHSTTQYDTVRHCTTQYDTVRHSTTQYDTVRRVVQCRTAYICIYMYVCIHSTTQYDTVRHNTTQYDTVRHSTTQYDTVRHCTTQYDTVRHSTTRRTVSYDIYMYIYVCMYIYIYTHTHTYIHCRLIVDTVGML